MADFVHDSEYYILDAQHGEVWAGEDRDLESRGGRLLPLTMGVDRPPFDDLG